MITATFETRDYHIDIMARKNQQISEVLRVLTENGRMRHIDEEAVIYSHRKREYIDKRLTFKKAGIYSGDILEIKSKDNGLLRGCSDEELFSENEGTVYNRGERIFISGCNADVNIKGFEDKVLIEKNKLVYGNHSSTLEEGAILLLGDVRIVVGSEYIKISGGEYSTSLYEVKNMRDANTGYPIYKRSPRLTKRAEGKSVTINVLPPNKKRNKRALLQMILPLICMLLIMVSIVFWLENRLITLMLGTAAAMAVSFFAVRYFHDRKEQKAEEEKRAEICERYLLKKRKEIFKLWNNELQAYSYNYPCADDIYAMVQNVSSRIYERSSPDDDFLTLSVGEYRDTPVFKIDDKSTELELNADIYLEEIKDMKKRYGIIRKPQIVDLKNTHLGLVGDRNLIHEQLKNYICQLSFMQSYHDVQYIALFKDKYSADFGWMKWLPHARIQSLNVSGLIGTDKIRDQVLGSMQQILKDRKQILDEGKKETGFLPHYVFIIDEPKMIIDHSIMEYLSFNTDSKLGVSIIYTTNRQASLPDYIETILLLDNSQEGHLLLHEKKLLNRKLETFGIGQVNIEMLARNLGVLRHEQGIVSHIPESITFFEMYDVQNPEELRVRERWENSNSSKTLSVPIGARTREDMLELNLHEMAHGPHGLLAGTTGSGKSEIIQSYILSLAVNFHPYEVGFLLIDYKGGGMANLFKNLPHLLGTITNLDGSEGMRALASIQSELRSRQRIFGENDVNHINAYNDLFKEGKVMEPIPHLFIISDEFAELKKQQPEFIKELVSTARIGRSLGVHLILATQKPTGVVDDQIWTNSRFKLCLKVQNEADSKEVLHTPDAANISYVGRAYLQVGNNDIYEMFQSAFSGAVYIRETQREITQDNRVYIVNELGQGELINRDLRGGVKERAAQETQLDAVVNYIHEEYEMMQSCEVKKPWLPPLSDKIVNPNMELCKGKLDLSLAIGIRDIPEEQRQEEYQINPVQQGNLLYVASSGFGKSVFLTNTALHLAIKNEVSDVNFYILDFGNNALISLSKLPHTADYIMLDDEEKFSKFRELIMAEIQTRKRIMAESVTQSFAVYNEISSVKMKAIIILIDNYDAVKEMGYEAEEYFTRLTRDGIGLGIYTIVTASRSSAIRFATLNNFKNKIAGVNFDEGEVKALIGRSKYALTEIKGRALVKIDELVSVMQLYTPMVFDSDLDYSKKLQELVEYIREAFAGEEAPHIPILPEEMKPKELFEYPTNRHQDMTYGNAAAGYFDNGHAVGQSGSGKSEYIYVGLDKERVTKIGFNKSHNPFLILGESGTGKTNALRIILNQINSTTYIVDSKKRELFSYRNEKKYIITPGELEDLANDIDKLIKERKFLIDESLKRGSSPAEIMSDFENINIVIDDIDDFCDMAGKSLPIIAATFEQASAAGINFIVTAGVNKFKGTDIFTRFVKNARDGLLLSGQGYLTLFPVKLGDVPAKPDAFMMLEGEGRYVRVPRA